MNPTDFTAYLMHLGPQEYLTNIKLLDEDETRNTIYVASVSEPHKYALLERGVAEPNNGVLLTKQS